MAGRRRGRPRRRRVLFPGDGTINPGPAALALARAAVDRGVRYVPGTEVTGFRRGPDARRVTGLTTSAGAIDAEVVVLAAGLWTSELARLAGGSVALYPAEHVWVMTDETPAATPELPFLRDLDGYFYIRHHGGRFVIGAFEPNGKPWPPSRVPTDGFVELGPDWEHFGPVLEAARVRVPAPRGRRVSTTSSADRRASRPTPTCSSGSFPRCRACSSRPG